ncbi:MAG TPA: endonuclease MutS2 [Spirochaetia bacterium]|nr:endonuclease MutS2 [Spirochaetia bacterium]
MTEKAARGSAKVAHARKLLEFDLIIGELSSLALTVEGSELLAAQEVEIDVGSIGELHDLSGDIKRTLEARRLPPVDFPAAAAAVAKLSKEGAVCEGPELSAAARYCRSAARLVSFFTTPGQGEPEVQAPVLRSACALLPNLEQPAGRVLSLLDEEGNVVEERVPELRAIRQRIKRLHGEIAELTSRYMSSDRDLWQADVPTERDGRTVLPLKANFKGRVSGIVHEVSATGATLFIEPLDIVDRNNQLVEQDNEYRRVVHRILRELTELLRGRATEILGLLEHLSFIDSAFARARYSVLHECSRAEVSGGPILLKQARHPLLGAAAVPIDVEMGAETRIMIITGANTGGKTVALKTVGLLALMNQFGMDIPAEAGSILPLFDCVLVDIGDDQSIADSLSTFSGHMHALAKILAEATPASLILLDEIGSGTDPTEGSAIAMAVLDRLLAVGPRAVATTHHGVIKGYALAHPGVINASVAFDTATLSPTYELIQGLPGESHALEIASRSSIPPDIVAAAREYVERGKSDLDRAAEELAARKRELIQGEEVLQRNEEKLAGREHALSELESRLREREEETRTRQSGELSAFLQESRRELENLVRDLRSGEITREKTLAVKTFIEKLEQKNAEEERETKRRVRRERREPALLEPGQEVFVGENRRRGTVVRQARDGKWVVAVNTMRVTVDGSDLVPARRASQTDRSDFSIAVSDVVAANPPAIVLDLRGMRLESALAALEQQMDRALLAGISEFSVIHGKGDGILQKGVHDYLRDSGVVADFHFSPPEAGGFGKTIVVLGTKE